MSGGRGGVLCRPFGGGSGRERTGLNLPQAFDAKRASRGAADVRVSAHVCGRREWRRGGCVWQRRRR